MEQLYEDEILKKINKLQGLSNAKDTILQYARYIKLRKNGDIKDVGNANILIDCSENYIDKHNLINLFLDILGIDVTKRELTNNTFFNKIDSNSNVFVLDTIELQTTLKFKIADLRHRVNSNKNDTFILLVGYDFDRQLILNIADKFSWHIEVGTLSVEDKQNYIVNKLNENNIGLSKDCNSILNLASDEMPVIETTLLNMIVDCKLNNIDVVDDTILNKHYLAENDDVDKDVANTSGTKTALQELDELVGLNDIKVEIKKIVNYVKTAKCRHQPIMLHMALMGNAGCGKNEIARVIGKLFKEQGVLSKGDFIEVSRSNLVAGFVGQSALKVKAILEKAKGSVLYIDECYSLDGSASEKDFSHEVIAEIIKFMEDERQNICIIFGGYIEETKRFLESNRGFNSRVPFKLYFDDYTSTELYDIFKKMSKANNYKLSSNIRPILIEHFEKARQSTDFGNGRYARNILDKVAIEQAQRVATDNTADKDLIKLSDIKNVLDNLELAEPVKRQIGFAT